MPSVDACPSPSCRNRAQSMGVSVSEMKPDTRIATPIVTANSRKSRPTRPGMNSSGMNTATSESVIERIVKLISFEPSSAACMGFFPISRWRTMFSSITMASSTTKPTASVSAISDRLSRLKSSAHITQQVPISENGRASDGMAVARTLRRNRKITMTTRNNVSSIVNLTSFTDSSMESALS